MHGERNRFCLVLRSQQVLSDGGDSHQLWLRVIIHGKVPAQLFSTAAGAGDCVFRCTMPRLSDLPAKDISDEGGNRLYLCSVSVSPSVTLG